MPAFNIHREKEIAVLEFDQPDSKVNVLNEAAMREFFGVLEKIDSEIKTGLKALLITSKKDGIFIAGADIKEIENITSSDEAIKKADQGKEVLNRLHNLNLVTIAVINGACLGGGLELALACNYRVASFSERVRIGLPEVNLGLIPGFCGTQRLPRLVGLSQALKMILTGEMVSGKDAMKYGLVDKLFPDAALVGESIEFARSILEGRFKPRRKKKKKLPLLFLEDTPIGRNILFGQAKKNILEKTKGFYPAPLKALEVIKHTYGGDIKRGSAIESEAFGELAVTDISKNLIKVFYLNEEYRKLPWVDSKTKPLEIKKCGVIGAGVMGGGIAQLLSYNNFLVRLKDINYDALKKGLDTAYGLFTYALKRKKLKEHELDYKFGLISPTLSYKGFENADIIIEAVVEDLKIKQNLFKELSRIASPKAIFASNTSSLPIIKLSELTDSQERVIGFHFFNPVHRMPLVEIIRSKKTSDETVASAIAFARRIGKVVIVVGDVHGFLINRILLSYLNEAGFLVEEGIDPVRIDKIVRDFGMPMGPIELMDEIGVDVGYKVARILEEAYGSRIKVAPILEKVKEKGILGKKMKKGFYLHKGREKKVNPEIYKLIGKIEKKQISDEIILKRMIYLMINESARCLEEKVADRPHTIDIGLIMGTGFPPFRAGLLRYADSLGIKNIVNALKDFENGLGVRFKPCNYLVNLADKNLKFYM